MLKHIVALSITFVLAIGDAGAGNAQEGEGPFARFPAVSPDGATVAFSYQGDIWTVPIDGGRATRLTVHEAYESYPRWSPDGRAIAFVSDRYGSDDIFVMGVEGGSLKRLTYHSAPDVLGSWTPDGHLLFETRRTYVQVEREREIYRVSTSGGTPDRFLDGFGYTPRMSPDGRFVAFVFRTNGEFRKNYRGPANRDVWLYDMREREYSRLTGFDGNDFRPEWVGSRMLLFVSERDGTYNLFRLSIGDDGAAAGAPEQLTRFEGDGVRTFGVDADGGVIVLERRTNLYVMHDAGNAALLEVQVPEDDRFDPVVRRTFTNQASGYAVTPNGKYIAFVARGEIFVTENDDEKNRTVRLTRHPYRDRDATWLNDTTLIFVSDREGQYDLYALQSADPGQPDLFKSLRHRAVRLTDTRAEESSPSVAPDGKQIAYTRGRGTLVVAEYEDGRLRGQRVLQEGWASPGGLAWSPDSRWLAYSLSDLDFNTEIYIHAADASGEPVNFTKHPKGDFSPVWSRDGTKLGFISSRNNGDDDVWFVWLRVEDWQRTRQDWEELEGEKGEKGKGGPEEEKKDDEPKPIEIDFERIHERLVQVTSLPGNESDLAISHDGETFFFVSNRGGRQNFDADQDLHSVKWDGTDTKALTSGGQSPFGVSMGPDGKYLYMGRSGGRLARIKPDGGRLEALPFSARMDINYPQEREQVFSEAWRVLSDGFYDPDFHGRDWEALGEKYGAWAMRASTSRDFRDVFNMMLGELNASHLGLRGPDRAETQTERTGLLGTELDPVATGVRVVRVIPNSPADREASKLEAGDVIQSVDGAPVSRETNFYSLLADGVNQKIVLGVRAANGEERDVVIRPTGSLNRDLYNEWVKDRRELTERYSGGRLGYIHIQGMNWPSFERFERELVASGEGKEGIVIDVRYNGGGWTTDYLMAVLTVRQHSYTVPRGATDDLQRHNDEFSAHYPFGERLPLAAWTKPAVALCNASSFSNAEIFSHAFKTLGLGTLVGEPTFGAVISTGGRGLIDGSFVRLPFRGWYVKATGENMENGPAVPDIIVETRPDSRADGEDEQLRAAVEALLGEIDRG
jgi:tricorn protease